MTETLIKAVSSDSLEKTLRLTEMFYSLQGETNTLGLPTVFIRLTGCPLRCSYCDTEYAFYGGKIHSFEAVLEELKKYPTQYITVTGGEPLAQPNCRDLLALLCDLGFKVSLETSGAMSIADLDDRVSVVLDLKTPASNESEKNLYENIPLLQKNDQVKFVICDRNDYEWAKEQVKTLALSGKVADVWFSPIHGELSATDLADWIIADGLQVRFQLQLHKLLWADEPGR
mgnify:CR=1 FL=1